MWPSQLPPRTELPGTRESVNGLYSNLANRRSHGLSFEEAAEFFTSGIDYLEIFDEVHSDTEDRFIAVGPIRRGLPEAQAMTDIPELTPEHLTRGIQASVRKRLMRGELETGGDVAALRRFVGLAQTQFAQAVGISVHTLRNWEQGRRHPEGPAVALLRIAARHPRIIRESLATATSSSTPRSTALAPEPIAPSPARQEQG
jgi:putative transcriptional regulator